MMQMFSNVFEKKCDMVWHHASSE